MKFGYREDTDKTTIPHFEAKHKTLADLPAAVSLGACLTEEVLDQGQHGACGGHGSAEGTYAAAKAHGLPLAFVPSPRGLYALARSIARARENPAGTLPTLTDDGVEPRDVMAAIDKYGLMPITPEHVRDRDDPAPRYSDVDDTNVNSNVRVDEIVKEAGTKIPGATRIAVSPLNIASSIASKSPVCFGIFVDSDFCSYAGGAPIGAQNQDDPDGGGHWMMLHSYRTGADGKLIFTLRNSWGPSWGDTGDADVTEAFIVQITDAYSMALKETT